MESFRFDGHTQVGFEITVEQAADITPEIVQTLVDIDLQTFAESTFSHYTAAAFLRNGCVNLLRANDVVIGTCVSMRCWDRPHEAMILSMGIRPGWRGQGLGQRFVYEVLERLRAKGLRTVSLYVGADNRRAVKVYRDVGFQVVEEGPTDRDSGSALLLMRATLQQQTPLVEINGGEGRDTR